MSRDDPAPRKYRSVSERYAHGGSLRRFASILPSDRHVHLTDDHPAVIEGRTLFPSRVEAPEARPRLLIDGKNSRKIGNIVQKGRLRGCPIFTLTLEERATCPRTCLEWKTCYGNTSNWSRRIKHGPRFEKMLWTELAEKQRKHPGGFLVRLHVLGDFYSVDYAELWAEALEAYPALNVFGYTARAHDSEIGAVIAELIGLHPTRFCIRFSGLDFPTNGSVVVDSAQQTSHVICPAQLGKTDCCATCAFCWHSERTVAFLRH